MKSVRNITAIIILNISLLQLVMNQSLSQDEGAAAQGTEYSVTKNHYLKTARECIELKDYSRAFDELEMALLLEPENAEAIALREKCRQILEEKKPSPNTCDKTQKPKETTAAGVRSNDVSGLLQDVHTAIQEYRYDDAGVKVDAVLKIDPANKEALYLKEKINNTKHKHVSESLKITHEQEKLRGREYLRESAIPYQDTLRFPAREQWERISRRVLPELDKIVEESKKKTGQLRSIPNPTEDSPSKIVNDALDTIISFEFVDTPLKDIVVFVREKTSVNMVIDPEAGNIPVTLKLADVPLRTALKYILPKGYEYVIEGDIIHFYKQKMELRVYDVRDVLINLDDKEPLEFDITAAATSQMSMRKGGTAKRKDPSERVLDLIELITTTVEPPSWSNRVSVIGASAQGQRSISTSGQGEGSITARNGQPGDIVVVNSKYVHEQIENLLASLRSAQNLQVSIEARFITVTDEFLEDIGNNITRFLSDKTSVDAGANSVSGNLGENAISGLNLSYSIFNNSMLKGFLKAVQESKDSEILTSPRITLSNTQRGNIAVVKTINYIQSTSVSEGIVTPVIGTIPEGTTFDVRPIVSADRKNVYLEVTPSVFEVEEITSFTFSGLSSDVTVGGTSQGTTVVPPEQTVQLPKVNVSQISVTVCVPDKGTLMIGGLGSINKKNLTSGIPILSKIPVLKRLFSRDQKTQKKSNLVILLKPTILIREEQEANYLSQTE